MRLRRLLALAACLGSMVAGAVVLRLKSSAPSAGASIAATSGASTQVRAEEIAPTRETPPPAAHALPSPGLADRSPRNEQAPPTAAPPEPTITVWAVDSMGVFRRAQSEADVEAERAAREEIARLTSAEGAPGYMDPGRPVPGSYRVLSPPGGQYNASLYAFRTDNGKVCAGLTGKTGGCFEGFTAESSVNWTLGDTAGGVVLLGFVPDRVTAVSAIGRDGQRFTASVHDNAFYLEIPGRTADSLVALSVTPPAGRDEERIPL